MEALFWHHNTASTGTAKHPTLITETHRFALDKLLRRMMPKVFHHSVINGQLTMKNTPLLKALFQRMSLVIEPLQFYRLYPVHRYLPGEYKDTRKSDCKHVGVFVTCG